MYSLFEHFIDPFQETPRERPPKSFFAFCRYYTRGMEKYLFFMAALTGAFACIEVFLFSFLGELVDWLSTKSPETLWQTSGTQLISIGLLVVIGIPATIFFQSLFLHQTLLGNYPMAIRWRAHRYLLGQSMHFFQDEFAGRIATKVMQTSLAVRETIVKVLDVFLYVAVFFSGIIVVVANLDLRLAVPFCIWLLAYLSLLYYFLPRLKEVASKQADARSEMTGRVVDTYTNISTVKLFSHSFREEAYAKESMQHFLNTVHPQMRLVTTLITSVWAINALLIFSVVAIGLWLWSETLVRAGAIAVCVGIVMRLYGMSQWVMWEVSGLFENIGTVQDGMNTLSQAHSVVDKPQANELEKGDGEIEFNSVIFDYGNGENVIDDFSLTIKPGEKIGLVGRSGAGKSTLVNLLLRFYDVKSGTIKINGTCVADITQESLRRQIGMVTQDTSLLHRSVRENLKYGKPEASEEDMLDATQKAHAHEFILSLSDAKGRSGYDAHVGERGVKLSGGQRQRVAIARVLLKNAPILVLDEATSALDSEVEAAIQENLYKLMQGKTVIAIAHRLSTISTLDRLVVIDKGKIVEQGSHQELLANNGIYAQLWARQSGGFLGD